jgi:Protein phosphatase 2C
MTAVPPLPWRALRAVKRGHAEAEYEDAWAANPRAGRFAVADGASETSYADLWARLLAEGFVAARSPWETPDWLSGPRQRWSAAVDGLDLPWYAEMKREQGAFATLVGLAVRPPAPGQPGRWRALAIGDSCLVRLRDGQRPRSFPLTKSQEFGNQPSLLGSRPHVTPAPTLDGGSCQAGDRFFLMTDALAQWFLLCCEKNRRPWNHFGRLMTQPDEVFAVWVEKCRARDHLRNDDVTLLAIGPIPEAVVPQEDEAS